MSLIFTKKVTLLTLLVLIATLSACKEAKETAKAPPSSPHPLTLSETVGPNSLPAPKKIAYGIDCSDLTLTKRALKPRQNLSDILCSHGVPYSVIHEIATTAKPILDVTKIRAGTPYCLITDKAAPESLQYIVFEKTPKDYVTIDLKDTVRVYAGHKRVDLRTRTVSAVIDTSLWESFTRQGLDFQLAMDLADIYAWTIDFHHLQKGNHFTITFQDRYIDNKRIGSGNILSACFSKQNKNYYAFYFKADGQCGYFDENAASLQKAFLKAPLKYSRISSRFSRSRFHPILRRYRPHLGIDYAAPKGTPVVAIADGRIIKSTYQKQAGRYVRIRHNSTYTSQYMHLSRFAKKTRSGKMVKQGDVIGYVGSSGLSTGSHLDFRIWKNGTAIDPLKIDIPSKAPLRPEYYSQFIKQITTLKQEMDTATSHHLAHNQQAGLYPLL